MLSLTNVKVLATNSLGRTGLLLQKKAPEIMLAGGVVGVVVGTVLACKATLKADELIKDAKSTIKKIEKVRKEHDKETYSDQEYKKDLAITYAKTAVNFLELYGPSVLVMVGSVALIVGAHNILSKRNAALAAAYEVVNTSFKSYRDRVRKELGDDADHKFRFGNLEADEVAAEVDGVEKKDKVIHTHAGMYDVSEYARFFDNSSSQFRQNYEYNVFFLQSQQNYANDMLNSRGHVFLNEIYDALGIPRSKAGAVVGWVKGHGDSFIDFGVFDPRNEKNRDFVNGYNGQALLLDFNVDGVIYDMI